jgi:hypothetical protein
LSGNRAAPYRIGFQIAREPGVGLGLGATQLLGFGHQAFLNAAGTVDKGTVTQSLIGAYPTLSWAPIPRDRGHSFHGMLGSHSTGRWAADLTGGFMESGLR